MSAAIPSRRALRPPLAAKKLGIGLSTLWMMAKTDVEAFPQPFRIGPRVTVWFEDELDQYLLSCAAKARAAQGERVPIQTSECQGFG